KLFVFNGNGRKETAGGSTVIPPGSWNHVVVVRQANRVKVFLNGAAQPEIDAELTPTFGDSHDYCLGVRSDDFAPLVGNLAEAAVFARPLEDDAALRLFSAAGRPAPPRTLGWAMGVREKKKPADCKIHIGGEVGKLGPAVPRGTLSAYATVSTGDEQPQPMAAALEIPADQSGRLQLAAWLTRPEHPQTARVIVNRVWQHMFGAGIVATADDFGVYGARPSHPGLLDHLAQRLVREGWSLKRLIRTIALCRAYQLDSRCDAALWDADPDNRLLGRHTRRRLDAEELRDSMLAASGQLDLSPGEGSDVAKVEALVNWPPGESTNLHRKSNRRSVYLCMLRHAPPPELAEFDLPDGVAVAGRRSDTVLPTQSLYLLNNPLVVEQSAALAAVCLADSQLSDEQRVALLFGRTLQRQPAESELRQAVEYVRATQNFLGPQAETSRSKAWASLCQALLITNEFRYVD
ncbi:MAG: DUF1553 domain-containing protein, partial [Planctomycetales bacterium]|nr:DUF1553 domain-containing protein [Planctomycetales bacterium]